MTRTETLIKNTQTAKVKLEKWKVAKNTELVALYAERDEANKKLDAAINAENESDAAKFLSKISELEYRAKAIQTILERKTAESVVNEDEVVEAYKADLADVNKELAAALKKYNKAIKALFAEYVNMVKIRNEANKYRRKVTGFVIAENGKFKEYAYDTADALPEYPDELFQMIYPDRWTANTNAAGKIRQIIRSASYFDDVDAIVDSMKEGE